MPRPQGEIGSRGPVGPRTATEGEVKTVTVGARGSMPRWHKELKSLSWEVVRPWVTQFGNFLRDVELTEGQAKVLLLQHVKGIALAFIEALIGSHNFLACLD